MGLLFSFQRQMLIHADNLWGLHLFLLPAKNKSTTMTTMTRRIDVRFLLLATIWMVIIFWFSSQPKLFYLPESWMDFIFKKGAHAFAYGVLWLLWWLALGRRRKLLALTIAIGYALSDEWHQTFVPGRHGQWFDVGVDAMGAVLALLLVHSTWGRRLTARLTIL